MICKRCGAEVNENLYICPKCGAVLAERPTASRQIHSEPIITESNFSVQNNTPPQKTSKALIVVLIIMIVILAALIAAGAYIFIKGQHSGSAPDNNNDPAVVSAYESDTRSAKNDDGESEQSQSMIKDIAATETGLTENQATQTDTTEMNTMETYTTEAPVPDTAVSVPPESVLPEADTYFKIDMSEIDKIFSADSADYGIYIKDLKNVVEYKNAMGESSMTASALVNIPLLYTIAAMADRDLCSLSDMVPFKYTMDGRGRKTKADDGSYFSIGELLDDMLKFSDNNATNSLLAYFGMENITIECNGWGFDSVDINIYIGEKSAQDNYASAQDLGRMLEVLYGGYFNSIDTDYMKNHFVISDKTARKGIGKYIPEDYGFLNHNGVRTEIYNEATVVYGGDAEYIIVVLSDNGAQDTEAEIIAQAAAYVHSCLTGN